MKAIKTFEEFIKEGIVKKITPDKSRAEFLFKESEQNYKYLLRLIEKIGVYNLNANDYIKKCHDILMELIRAAYLEKDIKLKVQDFQTYDIYYDPEGDFLEILFGESPEEGHSEEIKPGIFIHKVDETDEIYGIGIISFRKRPQILDEVLKSININFPLNITSSN